MTAPERHLPASWPDALLLAELFAVSASALGGIVLRGRQSSARERLCGWVRDLLAPGPVIRVPSHVTEERLLGGVSLAATLEAGRPVTERGLLAAAHEGALVVSMSERLRPSIAVPLCAALDEGALALERDGLTGRVSSRIGVVALDEGIDDERTPARLSDRLAFFLDVDALDERTAAVDDCAPDLARVDRARDLFPRVSIDDVFVDSLCSAAFELGIESLRGPVLAASAARCHAALRGAMAVEEADVVVAARLVLGPRATRLPSPGEVDADEGDSSPQGDDDDLANEAPNSGDAVPSEHGGANDTSQLDEVVLKAAGCGLPQGLLDGLPARAASGRAGSRDGRSGEAKGSTSTGRPVGSRQGNPRDGERLNVVETLRAAAPWQRLRRAAVLDPRARRIHLRREDFRVTRFEKRTESSVIFSVDASGSAALQRMAEAKGAVEQVLIDCYVRRDHVALIAFRGRAASLLLSPTRSLTRVRRSLAELAGGGTTPLASGIDAARLLALDSRRRGQAPVIVLMTDGRANVSRDGSEGATRAASDATESARAVRNDEIPVLFLDTAPRPRQQARDLAKEMGARYVPLPYLDARGISREIRSLSGGAS